MISPRTSFLLLLAPISACDSFEACDIHAEALALAGDGATDCGEVAVGADGTDAWACAIDAWNAGTPFLLLQEHQGSDSVLTRAMVSNGAEAWVLATDSYDHPVDVDGWDCIDPVEGVYEANPVVTGDPSGYAILECTSTAPESNHYQVCGAICGPESCSPQPLPFDP